MLFKLTNQYWYRSSLHLVTFLLLPFSYLFGLITALRRVLYKIGIFKTHRFNVPIIVVGNITVGGTGKTPLVIAITQFLQAQGYKPGIVSRGVGGKNRQPHCVTAKDTAYDIGDEAVLLFKNTHAPFVIGVDRVAAVKHLLANFSCDVIIADDGLQHYGLGRDIAIAVIDGVRGFGNQQLLPAGPLREPERILKKMDFVLVNGENDEYEFNMTIEPTELISLTTQQSYLLKDYPHKQVHAVAAIGHPERFFNTLKQAEFMIVQHIFKDHHHFKPHEFKFADQLPIIMTEKDAVKCWSFADDSYWYLKINAKISCGFQQALLAKLNQIKSRSTLTKF